MAAERRAGLSYLGQTLEGFLAAVGKQEPVPGGGAVAAYAGALGAALGQMVAAYTSGPKFQEVEQ